MDIESSTGDDSLTIIENSLPSDVLAKLRRLKIQESILAASLYKSNYDLTENTLNAMDSTHSAWKVYSTKLRSSVYEIKNMIENIKYVTSESHDNLENVDINEVRKDVLELDGKIKSLEEFISSELLTLQNNEEDIMRQLKEEPKVSHNIMGKVKIQSKQYNEVVPSPVRVLRNSPLKCAEVQRLQEFMSKSKNRYGGWNEYNHNSFVQIWNRFYDNNDIEVVEKTMQEINKDNLSQQFTNEVREKIPDLTTNEILIHSKWYSEYCYLKICQQKALDKWKDNKRKIKRRQNVKRNINSSGNSNTEKLCRKQFNNEEKKKCDKSHIVERDFMKSQNSFSNILSKKELQNDVPILSNNIEQVKSELKCAVFAKPTKQWINRCYGVQESSPQIYSDIETVDKLCIPNWRVCLK